MQIVDYFIHVVLKLSTGSIACPPSHAGKGLGEGAGRHHTLQPGEHYSFSPDRTSLKHALTYVLTGREPKIPQFLPPGVTLTL